MPRRLSLLIFALSLVAVGGCSQETPQHPVIKHVPAKLKEPQKDPSVPAVDEKNPPKYKAA